jgi:hypothetical protein
MLDNFLVMLNYAGYVRVPERPFGKQYTHSPRFVNKGRPEQRFAGHTVLMEHTEVLFNEHGSLELIDAR